MAESIRQAMCMDASEELARREPVENSEFFAQVASLWSAWLGFDMTAADVAKMMALWHVARSVRTTNEDEMDAMRFMAIAAELLTEERIFAPDPDRPYENL